MSSVNIVTEGIFGGKYFKQGMFLKIDVKKYSFFSNAKDEPTFVEVEIFALDTTTPYDHCIGVIDPDNKLQSGFVGNSLSRGIFRDWDVSYEDMKHYEKYFGKPYSWVPLSCIDAILDREFPLEDIVKKLGEDL